MKAIVQTQHMENYGAHDWDGQGECPQYWKPKGGNTYIFNCTIEDNMNPEWWARVEAACTSKSDYFEEYSVGETVVDDIHFLEGQGRAIVVVNDSFSVSGYCADWDAPYYGTIKDDRITFHRTTENQSMSGMRAEIAKEFTAYDVMDDGEVIHHGVSYEMINGDIILFSELRAWLDTHVKEAA